MERMKTTQHEQGFMSVRNWRRKMFHENLLKLETMERMKTTEHEQGFMSVRSRRHKMQDREQQRTILEESKIHQ
jgi:hypothetical protein